MSISISTSDYKKVKKVEIDGVEFEVRPMNSSESITLMALADDFKGMNDEDKQDPKKVSESIEKIANIFFGIFDKPKKAREILGGVEMDAWFSIYNKIMEQ